jgi:transposase
MFALTPRHRFYLYQDSCDMRKGFNGLSGLVRNETDADPLSGDVFVFINRSRTTMKLLVFEGDGYLLYHKRLAAGSFQKQTDKLSSCDATALIDYNQLHFLLRGVDLRHIKHRKRFSLPKPAAQKAME